MLGGAGSPGGDDLLTVTVVRDEHGYGMKVSGDNPVYVQSVKEHGAAWRAGLRAGDRILRVDNIPVQHHSHQQVVHLIRANPTTVLTVQQNTSRLKTPITAPVPANLEKQRQFEASKVKTMRLMLEKEQKYIRDLRNELLKVPDVRKQAELESAEHRCSTLQHEIDLIIDGQLPATPRVRAPKPAPATNAGSFLSGLPRSLSNLTGQSLRNLRQRQKDPPVLVRQNSDESNTKRRHNNTVPMVPTTCLDNISPPPLPPRSIERPKRNPLSPNFHLPSPPLTPQNPLACNSKYYNKRLPEKPHPNVMHQSMPSPFKEEMLRRSSHSLDGELEGPLPNSLALQMSYPLVNAPPPPLQTDNRTGVPVLHMRSRSSPEQLDHDLSKSLLESTILCGVPPGDAETVRDTPPPGTPPPPYHNNTQPCSDPQRAIISMEEDDSPTSDNSSYSGLFSNLRSVRESKARTAVLLNWLLGERRCARACLVLVLTDGYRGAGGVALPALRRWAYEIHSTFLIPHAVLQLNGVDENMANEIEHVLVNEYEKEELIRSVFRKARQKAKEELAVQLADFQLKRQLGLAALYAPHDSVLDKCDVDKQQEQAVVEQLLCTQLRNVSGSSGNKTGQSGTSGNNGSDEHNMLLAALVAAALCLHCRPAAVAAAVGGQRATFLQRDKFYKQRVKQITKQNPQPFVVRGHHLSLQALTSVAHCHHCDHVITGLAPQAYVCNECKLRVHRGCARHVEESCVLPAGNNNNNNNASNAADEHHNTRISRFIDRIHTTNGPDSSDKKSRKASGTAHFLNMERSFRKNEDEQSLESHLTSTPGERRDESDESLYESADGQSDAISASDDALPRLSKTPTISKESLKLAVTDEEADLKFKKGHRKAISLSNPLEMVKNLGDEWLEAAKEINKNCDKKKSRESLWSEEDRDSIHGSTNFLDQSRKNSKKEDKSQSNSRKSSTADPPKTRKTSKGSSVSALNFLRRKKTPTSIKPVEVVAEDPAKVLTTEEILNYTKLFLDYEKRYSSISLIEVKPPVETDSEDEPPAPKLTEHRRRLSRQTSRSKSKARGKSQSLKVNTLRKSHSGTLKKGKKKSLKSTPTISRSRQASLVEPSPTMKKKHSESMKQNSWLFSGNRGETKREGSNEEPSAPDGDVDAADSNNKEAEKDNSVRAASATASAVGAGRGGGGAGVNRAESCRERDAPRRGKHRNASDPNRLTAHNHTDLEPGAATAPSGSSSSSSLSSRSNESNTVAAEQHASQSELSEEEEPLAAQWADSIPPHVLATLTLSNRLRKRQEVIHELIVSESSHVRWLRVLGKVFLRPLTAATLLPPEDLRALFPNLPAVKDKHVKLLSELRQLRVQPIVDVGDVARVMLNTLGEQSYASCLARFCRNQRLALDTLRERRRKNKELHQFLCTREQLPTCGRLQLRDLLACVWQRLTKYQLLLESIIKTVSCEDGDSEEDLTKLNAALLVAKDVLHTVDTSIRTAENEHRLRSIQNKLEIRAAGPEWDELRKLDLRMRTLTHEGDLQLRHDTNKKTHVLALMLEDCLVLFHREGDKFVLKPIPQPSPQQPLSPLVRWDKVLFRANAAVRNTFFLMNINGVQMHELSANSASEYATWVKHIQDAPLAKLTELKPIVTPAHHASRSTDDSGINVSRNPSDASEKSNSTMESECERDRTSVERSSSERERDGDSVAVDDSQPDKDEDKEEKEEKHKVRRPTVGRISTHSTSPPPLEPRAALTVTEPPNNVMKAEVALSTQERLRRLDEIISRSLSAKAALVCESLGVPPPHRRQVAELAVAETLAQAHTGSPSGDFQQLVLAACSQAEQLTTDIRRALSAPTPTAVAARAGRCDVCRVSNYTDSRGPLGSLMPGRGVEVSRTSQPPEPTDIMSEMKPSDLSSSLDDMSYDTLVELETSACENNDEVIECGVGGAVLAARLAGPARGLQAALSGLLAAAVGLQPHRDLLAQLRDENHKLRATVLQLENEKMEALSLAKSTIDPFIPDQPSNGG